MVKLGIACAGDITAKLKRWPKEVKAALFEAIRAWHGLSTGKIFGSADGFLKFHFTPQAFHRYPGAYKARSVSYTRQKERKYGHSNPLEFTGTAKRQIRASISISGTAKNARGTMQGTKPFNFGGRAGMPDMNAEVRAVNDAEAKALAEFVHDFLVDYMNKNHPEEARRVQFEEASGAAAAAGSFSSYAA
jgi:hypothetical protein